MRGRHRYDFDLAQRKADRRMAGRPHPTRFSEDMKQEARKLIVEEDNSPEQVARRCRLRGKDMASHETLYQ